MTRSQAISWGETLGRDTWTAATIPLLLNTPIYTIGHFHTCELNLKNRVTFRESLPTSQ